jgi:hypothetical protein
MKVMNKRFVKALTLILSCLLLIGAAVGITVAAEESAPEYSISIAKKNLAYEGAVEILYLVEAPVVPEGAKVVINFTDDDLLTEDYTNEANGKYTLGETEYYTVYSDGIVAKEYRKALKATPVLLDAEGNTLATGETVNFTPYDYAMARFDGNYTAAQLDLYKAFLDYGAAVQAIFFDDSNIAEVGGWADAYYLLTVDGVASTLRGKTFNGKLTADRFLEGGAKSFTGWTDG